MASMAVDVLDLNWRILQGEEKPCTPKGKRRIRCNPSRARGDRCHEREGRSEGSRVHAMERELRRIDLRRPIATRITPLVNEVADSAPPTSEEPAEQEPVIRTPVFKRIPIRLFDPDSEMRRDTLRCEIRDLEIRIPHEDRDSRRHRLERRLTRKKASLRQIEGALSAVA